MPQNGAQDDVEPEISPSQPGGRREMGRIAAIVPAFNEASNVERVVRGLLSSRAVSTVFVIDDGSSDETAAVAARAGATVLQLPFNCGIGAAVQTGLRAALRRGFEIVVRLDGDAQHDPGEVPALLAPLAEDADFVLGSRNLARQGFQATPTRRIGGRWFSILLQMSCGLRVTDPTSGFWAANRSAALVLLSHTASDYPEVDSLVHLSRAGLRVREVPVQMLERPTGRSSIGGLLPLYYMVKVTVALVAVRLGRPIFRRSG
jgi:glycosyltransferase involved in cell wall biosynthesis